MTYYELIMDAVHKLNFNQITCGEYEEMIEPLKREIEEQPCEDCISRQATIDAIYQKHIGGKDAIENAPINDLYACGLEEAVDAVENMPPITPQQTKFIPVSERMPQKTDYYLIQYSREVCPDEMAVAFYSVEEAEIDSNYTWEFKPIADCKEVIAWQPLPESYEEGSRKE